MNGILLEISKYETRPDSQTVIRRGAEPVDGADGGAGGAGGLSRK
ncbi:hypothetical protein [Novosphingobium sp.]|nr:hypothetical protein [Novosphingobium sp.]MDP3908243.1 hypothetical protein [Novosphingobium sp.]